MKQFFTLLIILFSVSAYAQKGSVKGFVYDKASGEGIPFATVKVDSTDYGAATDDHGFFYLPSLPEGHFKLTISYVGYQAQSIETDVKANTTNNIKFFLRTTEVNLTGVEISAKKQDNATETRVSVTSITPVEMKRLPGVGGEADIAQYLPVLPGVVSTGDQGGQIVIRGGTPIQTQFLLDGIPIYNPFHSIGLFSVYETDVVKNIDVYAGGFPAQYGGRTSAVVDVTTRDGNRKNFSGKVGVSPFMAHLLLEIPIIKLKEEDNVNASLILSGKTSYLDQTSKVIYKYANKNGLPYNFYDGYGKFSINMGQGTKLSLTGFDYNDNANFQDAKYGWNTFGVGGNFLAVPRNSNLYFNTHASYSEYRIHLDEADTRQRSSKIGGFDIGMDFTYYIRNGELKYGLDIQTIGTDFDFINPFGQNFIQSQNTTDLSAYFTYHKYIKKLVVLAGGRFEYYGKVGGISPEPRLSLKYNVRDFFRLKLATGMYSQNFIGTTSSRDVVTLFNGFLTGPDGTGQDASGKSYENIRNFQRSADVIFGVEADLPKGITLNVETYYKYFWHQFALNRLKQFNTDPDYLVEKGDAYGVDLLAKWQFKGFFFYASYSFAFTHRNDGVQTYPPSYDRRHNINLLATYDFGKKRDWEISARWNMGSGFPFTRTKSFYENNTLSNGISSDYLTNNGQLGVLYSSQINDGRLPYYHRLDFSIKKTFSFKERMKFEIAASVTNAYNRENIFYFNRVSFERINQLPIIPSLNLAFTW